MDNKKQLLENLLFSDDLEELNLKANKFNIFSALRLQNNEIRHSNFIGWLMAPYETHGLKDYFLKEFLKSAIKNFSLDNNTELNLEQIAFANFDDAEIRREYKNIDILIISPKNNFVCIVENKIWTGEHDNQLERYADIVNTEFNNYKKMFIYLAPNQNNENELLDRIVHYIPMTYKQVYDVIVKILRFKETQINEEVKIFVEHYKKMLERNIMGETDEEIVNLCRKIYREHKEAIDLIVENNNEQVVIFEIIREILQERNDIDILSIEGNKRINFFPKDVNNSDKLKISDWQPYIAQLGIVNLCYGNTVYLELVLAAADANIGNSKEIRSILREHLKKSMNIKFNGHENWNYTPRINLISADEYYKLNCDRNIVKEKISNALENSKYIEKFREALNSWK